MTQNFQSPPVFKKSKTVGNLMHESIVNRFDTKNKNRRKQTNKMSSAPITKNHPRWSLYSRLRKCGEITTSSDGRHFALNCIYCHTIFPWVNIKDLLGHLHDKHASELHRAARQEQRQKQKPRKRKRLPTPVPPKHGDEACASGLVEDPLETAEFCAVSTINEDDYSGTEQAHEEEFLDNGYELEEQPEKEKAFESFSDSDDKEASRTQSENNSESENNDLPGYKLDLLLHENHEVLSYIIQLHRENPILWDKEHPHFPLVHKKLIIYKQMMKEIQCRFNITLTYANIRVAFKDLRDLYTFQLLHEDHDEQSERLWCFEKLEFLRNRELADNAELIIPMDQLLQFAEIYERHPVLWDLDCDDSHNRVRQIAELKQMLQEVNAKMSLNMTLKQFRQRLIRMRKYLRNDRRKRLKCEQDGNEEFEPQHPELYEKLQYLERFIGPHHCDKCGEEIQQYHALKAHLAAHEGRLPFTCSHCGKDFKHFGMLKIHLRRHTGEKPFACSSCNMRFATLSDLRTHASLHGNEKPYVCHVCGLAFRSNSLLYNHNSDVHEPNRFPCPQCPKTYSKKYLLKSHLNSHLQLRGAECRVCGKGFFSHKTLRQHMQLHDEVMRFQCEVCDKKFAQLAGLCSHRRLQHNFAAVRSSE